jgi:phosphatidylserine/phosphatidylglycerophosphate/cardiolipin synthase-like enzyme
MTAALCALSDRTLQELAAALRAGRISGSYTPAALGGLVSPQTAAAVAAVLEQLRAQGVGRHAIAVTLDLLRADRAYRPHLEDILELVTTGPDVQATPTRDTGVVVRELFANAETSVLVAGYAVYQGQRVFQALADRMAELPGLQVRLFLDIQRAPGDTSMPGELVGRFARRFRKDEWPEGRPLPQVFYDPRSLDTDNAKRACLHAKVVVVDACEVFISSANFTEAAQQRNIEVGVRFPSRTIAHQLITFFDDLTRQGALVALALRSGSP